jgi:hypothetical protein
VVEGRELGEKKFWQPIGFKDLRSLPCQCWLRGSLLEPGTFLALILRLGDWYRKALFAMEPKAQGAEVTNKACVYEEEHQVMSISVRLEALLADFHVGGSVHKDHDESIT